MNPSLTQKDSDKIIIISWKKRRDWKYGSDGISIYIQIRGKSYSSLLSILFWVYSEEILYLNRGIYLWIIFSFAALED